MNLSYRDQNSQQTLREAIDEYRSYLGALGRKVGVDKPQPAAPVWLYHDATHAIFGHETTLEEEAMLDFWVLFGTHFSWKVLRDYQQLPEVNDITRAIFSQLGRSSIPIFYWRNRRAIGRVFKNSRQLHKKWPFKFPNEHLDRTLADLRTEYGITLLTPQQRVPSRLTVFDYSAVSS